MNLEAQGKWGDKVVERLTGSEYGIAYKPYPAAPLAIAGFGTLEEAQAELPKYITEFGYAAVISRRWDFDEQGQE